MKAVKPLTQDEQIHRISEKYRKALAEKGKLIAELQQNIKEHVDRHTEMSREIESLKKANETEAEWTRQNIWKLDALRNQIENIKCKNRGRCR
jgi:DNA-nicking Smr family endonuclease